LETQNETQKIKLVNEIILNKEMNVKSRILKLLSIVERDGIHRLAKHLEETDFFTTPASTKFHGVYIGGLAHHSYNVFKNFWRKCLELKLKLEVDSIIVVGILHDLCKIDLYVKQPDGTYRYNPKYNGTKHGERSVQYILDFSEMKRDELTLIRYHMSIFSSKEYSYYGDYYVKELFESIKLDDERKIIIFASSDLEETIGEANREGLTPSQKN